MKIFMAKRASKLQMKIFYMVYFVLNLKKFGCCLFTLLSKEKSLSLSQTKCQINEVEDYKE